MNPIPFRWDGEAMVPRPTWAKKADEQFVIGEEYALAPLEDRSQASHGHYFAVLRECWQSLPEAATERFSTPEHLRKYCLIKAGYHDNRSIVAASKAEAQRVASFIKPMDEFAIVLVDGCTVTVFTAKSQSMRAMGKTVFQESKEAVIGQLATLLDVPEATLARAA